MFHHFTNCGKTAVVIIIIVIAVIAVMLSGGQRSSGALSSATFQPASDVSSGQATQETAKKAVDFILDPGDPVRFDMALCHLGIGRRCPSGRDDERCEGCALRDACVHWVRPCRFVVTSRTPTPPAAPATRPRIGGG